MSRDCTQGQKCYNCELETSRSVSNYVLTTLQAAKSDIYPATARPNPPASACATSASSPATSRLLAQIEPFKRSDDDMPIFYERQASPNWIDDPGREPAAEVSAEEERVRCGMGSVCCLGQGRLTSQFSNIITSSALALA
jgi:hypothetical protein